MLRTIVFFLTLALAAVAQQVPAEMKYDPHADPNVPLKAALFQAGRERKNVLMDVGGEWCSWCHRMDKFLTENAALLALLQKNYIVVKVNFSEEHKNEKFLSQYPKVAGYPHLFVLSSAGKLIVSKNTGELEEGKGYNLARFREFLEQYAPAR